MYESGFTIADQKTGEVFHFQPSERLRLELDSVATKLAMHHPASTVEAAVVELATAIGQQIHDDGQRDRSLDPNPNLLGVTAWSEMVCRRIEALEKNLIREAQLVSHRLDQLDAKIKQIPSNPPGLLSRVELLEFSQGNNNIVHSDLQDRINALWEANPHKVIEKGSE
jgi:hypothetical protein